MSKCRPWVQQYYAGNGHGAAYAAKFQSSSAYFDVAVAYYMVVSMAHLYITLKRSQRSSVYIKWAEVCVYGILAPINVAHKIMKALYQS